MNRTRLLGGLAAASLILVAGAASARTSQTPGPRADADRDGRMSRTEFVEARLAPLTAMDLNGDGTVTVAERTAARQARTAAAVARRFERLDADKDGTVSRAEFEAAATQSRPARAETQGSRHAARRTGWVHGRRGARPEGEAGRIDAPIVIADVRTRAEAAFDRLDTDKDGVLVRAERQAGREAVRTARRERIQARRAQAGPHGRPRENTAPASPATPASE